MAENPTLGETLTDALKAALSLRSNDAALKKLIEETMRQALEVDKLQITTDDEFISTDPGMLLNDLKQVLRKVHESASGWQDWLQIFGRQVDCLYNLVNAAPSSRNFDRKFIIEFCQALLQILDMAEKFSNLFDQFEQYLTEAQEIATKLEDSLKQSAEDIKNKKKEAERKKSLEIIKNGLAAVGYGAFAVFLMSEKMAGRCMKAGGRAWDGIVDIVGKAKQLKELRKSILQDSAKLKAIVTSLKGCSDNAGEIRMDSSAVQHLANLLEHLRMDQREEALTENAQAEEDAWGEEDAIYED